VKISIWAETSIGTKRSSRINEPPHIHIEHGDKVGKFWLNPVNLASSYGFRSHELGKLRLLLIEHKKLFLEKWHAYFGD
jgi:hypothetical protein